MMEPKFLFTISLILSGLWFVIAVTAMSNIEIKREKEEVSSVKYFMFLTNALASFFFFGLAFTLNASLVMHSHIN